LRAHHKESNEEDHDAAGKRGPDAVVDVGVILLALLDLLFRGQQLHGQFCPEPVLELFRPCAPPQHVRARVRFNGSLVACACVA
jgi:hypothetical protein